MAGSNSDLKRLFTIVGIVVSSLLIVGFFVNTGAKIQEHKSDIGYGIKERKELKEDHKSDIERLEDKMDTHHAEVMDVLKKLL